MNQREKALQAWQEKAKQNRESVLRRLEKRAIKLEGFIREVLGDEVQYAITYRGDEVVATLKDIDRLELTLKSEPEMAHNWLQGEDTLRQRQFSVRGWDDIGQCITSCDQEVRTQQVSLNRFAQLTIDEANQETRPFNIIDADLGWILVEYTDASTSD